MRGLGRAFALVVLLAALGQVNGKYDRGELNTKRHFHYLSKFCFSDEGDVLGDCTLTLLTPSRHWTFEVQGVASQYKLDWCTPLPFRRPIGLLARSNEA